MHAPKPSPGRTASGQQQDPILGRMKRQITNSRHSNTYLYGGHVSLIITCLLLTTLSLAVSSFLTNACFIIIWIHVKVFVDMLNMSDILSRLSDGS